MISELPVPLNSSKITSSIRLPVSISAVEIIVKDPPSSMLRAAPKNRLGLCNAFASTPPVNTLPEDGITVLNALPSLVIESKRITTSRLCSTRRLAFSITISETATCRVAGSSNVDEITSPFTDLCISVTSSGRSSIKSTIKKHSGWFLSMLVAMFCKRTVLPVRGGAVISDLWPFPIGATRSMIRAE